jgi:N-carbamoylputrescine amidase
VSAIEVIAAVGTPPRSHARVAEPERGMFRVGAVQQRWHPNAGAHEAALAEGIRLAADRGAQLVCLQELTLSPYFAIDPDPAPEALARAEAIPDGPTTAFATRMAGETGAYVHASLYERVESNPAHPDPRGFNTAICVAPDGTLVARTRKLHIPVTAGYHEDRWFRPGPVGEDAFPVRTRSSTRPRSAPSPTTRSSTRSRCGSRSSWGTGSPTGPSWSRSTASGWSRR